MCGIAGFFDSQCGPAEKYHAVASAMASCLAHRGPDDSGTWLDPDAGLALAHRRLSILDLSTAGRQPMISHCGRYVIVFNGEIYNHLDLRADLEAAGSAPIWRGHSDTETLLAHIGAHGIERTLDACVGMFAFAIWDRVHRQLVLARDRMGEKPLFYGWADGVFLFGSELKALRAHPAFRGTLNREALCLLLRYNYVPAPHSIFEGIFKLPAGCLLTVGADERTARAATPEQYWSFSRVALQGEQNPFSGDEVAAADQLERELGRAIQSQSIADVPLGALLSGGVDSSTVVALMQAHSTRAVKTFTIGFNERDHDEAVYAAAVARHLRTDHTELFLTSQDALDLIPELPRVYDEPFADSSQLPTQLVMRLARQHVTVALSGDGADELFGGYNRYRLLPATWRRVGWVPSSVRRVMGSSLLHLSSQQWDRVLRPLALLLGIAQPGDKVHKLAARMKHIGDIEDLFLSAVSAWEDPGQAVHATNEPHSFLADKSSWPALRNPVARMMALDAVTYLPDDILTKVDRASMAASLEARAPYLDHRVVAFACQLPMDLKLRGRRGKWLLRQVLHRYVPTTLVERPKMGFSVPLDTWLRGPLRDWAHTLLSPSRLRQQGYFDAKTVEHVWNAHLAGGSYSARLWSVLMFQAWLDTAGTEQLGPAQRAA
jgi:asparagine synthase (glutamine-hydrolysing)